MNEKLKEVMHQTCGNPAMLCIDRRYEAGEAIMVRDFRHLDGSEMEVNKAVYCESCGVKIIMFKLEDGTPYVM